MNNYVTTQICSKCDSEKSLELFTKNKKYPLGVTKVCQSCTTSRQMEWAKKTNQNERRKEYFSTYNKSYLANERKARWKRENKEQNAAINKAWRQRNPETQYKYARNFYKKYPHIVHEWQARRKAAKRNATPAWGNREKIQAFYLEAVELTKKTGVSHTVDHIYPIRGKDVCGLHVEHNLQVLTRVENSKKSHRIYP